MTNIQFSDFIAHISSKSLRVLDSNIPLKDYISLDLSKNNLALKAIDTSSSEALGNFVFSYITSNNAQVAFGGYNEVRNIYQRSTYFNQNDDATERNIHLGLDLWIEVDTPIYAPLEGTIHSFKNNENYGDYGPTLILKHNVNGVKFYTLYGHLSLASISNLKKGQQFKQGEEIATLGEASVNGDYPPHLHFQIIRDLQGFEGDYPGVCSQQDLEFYLGNCPDPNLLLKLTAGS
ncbi:peptidoglycan DD-metalloendopeptidase family protein [Geojedonia litorea]|uniref:Peptidoglycan DD-metalloendopeptidase family protein n=1 Tax=Geojedonia litorea TaxID=1268269 RepID=A0ABV9N2Y6_9FLAO